MSSAPRDDEPIIAPGVLAMLRRNSRRLRAAGAATMVVGVLMFLLALVTLPAGADPGHHTSSGAASTSSPADLNPGAPASVPAPAVAKDPLGTKPLHVAKPAPATRPVISGLAANGIPNVALNAYRVAAARLASTEPGCGIDWALLAGIGREESDHGQFAGATLNADGTSTPRIIGIPLNGKGTALIRDTDHGRLDGDTVYDHAVGPMQFIPSTWAAYASDGNGDGKADIFNINDAALAAARYLCAAGGDLRTHSGQVAAVLAYNHSDQYLAQVLALANAYRTGITLHGIPVGNTTGALPPVSNPGYAPPVNPGPPTALDKAAAKKAAAKKAAAAKSKAPAASAKSTAPASGGTAPAPGGSAPAGGSGPGGGSGGGGSASSGGTTPPPISLPTPTPTATPTCLVPNPLVPGQCLL